MWEQEVLRQDCRCVGLGLEWVRLGREDVVGRHDYYYLLWLYAGRERLRVGPDNLRVDRRGLGNVAVEENNLLWETYRAGRRAGKRAGVRQSRAV